MAVTTFTDVVTVPSNTSQAQRQAFLSTLSTAMVASGATFVESVVVDASIDYSVWSYPIYPSGNQYIRIQATASGSGYIMTQTMFDTWNTSTHTGTNAGLAQTVTLSAAASGATSILLRASNNLETPCINISLNGVFTGRILMVKPMNVPSGWLGKYAMMGHISDTIGLDLYPSAVNGGNIPIGINSRIQCISQAITAANARTGNIKYFAGLLYWWTNAYGDSFGPLSRDVALAHGSALNPLETISPDGKFRNIWASTNFSIMVRIAE